ncbi:hypothetical protein [Stieleria varia]|uniref:Uncharacterized protein n=1 Tax=Stieleria varia TaxID=2528005 RepID=A0A5C5ZI21_9BACT|nr:hypothetical protein [Stieleria varia]TWT87004.1 hypothetical protein Pla52n_70460 [Stieleria varia]
MVKMEKLTAKDKHLLGAVIDRDSIHAPILSTFSEKGWSDTTDIGIYRRIEYDQPEELIRGVVISVRQRWNSYANQRERNRFPNDLWMEVLSASAVHDNQLFNKMIETLPTSGKGPSNATCDLIIYERLLATIRKTPLPAEHFKHNDFKSRRRPYTTAILDCIASLSAADPEVFSAGLEKLLASSRNDRTATAERRLMCIHAHGLWEIGNKVNPQLISTWDVSTNLPWDRGFHAFVQEVGEASKFISDYTTSSHLLNLIKLQELRPS